MSGVWRAVRFTVGTALRTDARRLAAAATLMVIGYAATPLIAWCLRALTDAAVAGDAATAVRWSAAAVLLLVGELSLAHFAHLYYFELGERQEADLSAAMFTAVNGTRGLERLHRKGFTENLTLVREDLRETHRSIETVLQSAALIVQIGITSALLGLLDPWLLLLPVAAVPPVLAARMAQRVTDRAREATASQVTIAGHLLEVATSPSSAKEIRLAGAEHEIARRHALAWDAAGSALATARLRAAALRAAGQFVFACAYGAAIVLVLGRALAGTAGAGDVVLVITLVVQVGAQVSEALRLLEKLQTVAKAAERFDTLNGAADTAEPQRTHAAPERLHDGIRLDGVDFCYPGAREPVLTDVDLHLPSGAVVALVGENGAGKSTLVALLCGLLAPTTGTITIDGVPLDQIRPTSWRARTATLFQDFAHLEFTLGDEAGLGDLDRRDDPDAIRAALRGARALPLVDSVPGGLDGLVGTGYGQGAELSGGQWQSLALARVLMRRDPLLLVLDEPAAALDAAAEHELFERYGAANRATSASGGITLFISHRFSTVSMADLIVVLEGGRIADSGDHASLVAGGGLYRELFHLQERAYR